MEDEPAVRKLVRNVLQSRGYAVLESSSVDEALSTIAHHAPPIDLVISDTLISGKSSGKLAKHLQATRPDIALLLMSGVDAREERESDFGAGIPFISKPFNVGGFIDSVRAAIAARPRG